MKIIYAKEKFEDFSDFSSNKKIFLVGPTPRSNNIPSWRPAFINILSKFQELKDCYVFIPEDRDGQFKGSYLDQVEWEHEYLNHADIIVAWVPRELNTMPAFTTNVEFGYFIHTGKIVYGRPNGCPKNRYLDWLYEKETGRKPHIDMGSLAAECAKI